MSKQVVLRGDATQDTRDRYGRLLAYVWLPGGKDLGYQLIAGGFAKVYVYRDPFQRLSAYRTAGAAAKGATAGQWKACGDARSPEAPAAGGLELPPVLFAVPPDRRRPRLRRHPRHGCRAGSRPQLGPVSAGWRQRRLGLRVRRSARPLSRRRSSVRRSRRAPSATRHRTAWCPTSVWSRIASACRLTSSCDQRSKAKRHRSSVPLTEEWLDVSLEAERLIGGRRVHRGLLGLRGESGYASAWSRTGDP